MEITVRQGKKTVNYTIPSYYEIKYELEALLEPWQENLITPWEEATPWEKLADDRIRQYKKAGLVLRGARLREGISQEKLSKLCGVSQDNISKPLQRKSKRMLKKGIQRDPRSLSSKP